VIGKGKYYKYVCTNQVDTKSNPDPNPSPNPNPTIEQHTRW